MNFFSNRCEPLPTGSGRQSAKVPKRQVATLKNGCMPLSEQVSQPRVLPPIMSLYGPLWLALHVGHHSSLVCIRRYGEITAMESAVFLKAPLRSVVS